MLFYISQAVLANPPISDLHRVCSSYSGSYNTQLDLFIYASGKLFSQLALICVNCSCYGWHFLNLISITRCIHVYLCAYVVLMNCSCLSHLLMLSLRRPCQISKHVPIPKCIFYICFTPLNRFLISLMCAFLICKKYDFFSK